MIRFNVRHTTDPLTVTLALEELGLSYEVVPEAAPRDAACRAADPNGAAALVDGDVALSDAGAILLHLAETRGALLGAAADRPALLSWLFWLARGLGPVTGPLAHRHSGDPAARRLISVEAHRHFRVLDEHLAARTVLVGAALTIADVAAWGVVGRHEVVLGEGGLAGYPNLARWFGRIEARPAARRARALARSLQFAADGAEARAVA